MKAILIGLMVIVLLAGSVEALEWHYRCLNSTHLYGESSMSIKKGSNVYRYDLNDTIECEHGCDEKNDICNPTPTEQSWIFFGIFGVIIIIFYILYRVLR